VGSTAALIATLEHALCAVALGVFVAAAAALTPGWVRAAWARRRDPAALAFTSLVFAALAARVALEPALLHSNFHGYRLLQSALAFPRPSVFRADYGQAGFLAQGLAVTLAGGRPEAVFVLDVAAGTACVALAGLLAARMAGRFAALATVATGALLPPLVRIAASEDVHDLACFFGLAALVAADALRRRGVRDRWEPVLAVAATALAFSTRQTMLYWPLLVAACAAGDRARLVAWLRDHRRTAAALLAIAATFAVPRALALLSVGVNISSSTALAATLLAAVVPAVWRNHPLLWWRESAALTLLTLVALVTLRRRRDATGRVLAAGVAIAFVGSFGVSVSLTLSDAYSIRTPLFCLALPLCGVGAQSLRARLSHLGAAPAWALVVLAALAPAAGYATLHAEPDPLYREYRAIAHHAPALAPGVVRFARLRSREPSYTLPPAVFPRAGQHAAYFDEPAPAGPQYFFQGLYCFAYSLPQLCGVADTGDQVERALAERLRITGLTSALERLAEFIEDPVTTLARHGCTQPELRAECAERIPPGARFIPWGEVTIARPQLPIVYLTRRTIPIGVWELAPP
jgi:hypothetical protein